MVTPRADNARVRRSYKFRLRPTAGQHVALEQCLDAHRSLYNAALEERRGRWRWNRESVSYGDQSAQLKEIRSLCPEQSRWSFSSQQATLRRLNRAFVAFFRRSSVGEKPGYPRFRSEHRFDSVEWPKDGDGCRWKPEHRRVYLQGVGDVKVEAHRSVEGVVKTIAVKREGRHWFLILACDGVAIKPLPATGAMVGVDLGVTVFLATSDGDLVDNPRHGRSAAGRLAAAQSALARKQRGSNNRRRQRSVVANRYRKIAHQRRDFHHQIARRLVDGYDVLVIEELAVANMSCSASGTPEEPGVNVAAKRGLNRSILDAGWAQFASILAGKAEEAGRSLVRVDPRHTSQTCAACGHVDAGNRVSQAEFRCRSCGHTAHADVNAARNILRAGLARPAADAA
jgi:putative transposase